MFTCGIARTSGIGQGWSILCGASVVVTPRLVWGAALRHGDRVVWSACNGGSVASSGRMGASACLGLGNAPLRPGGSRPTRIPSPVSPGPRRSIASSIISNFTSDNSTYSVVLLCISTMDHLQPMGWWKAAAKHLLRKNWRLRHDWCRDESRLHAADKNGVLLILSFNVRT